MLKANIYDFSLFITALVIAFWSADLFTNQTSFTIALSIYFVFACLYYRLKVFFKNGTTNLEYGMYHGLSFVIIFGPLGLFIYETIFRFFVYAYRKWTKTADPTEFTDTFYNIGAYVVTNSLGFILYRQLLPIFEPLPFGYWILLFLLVCLTSYLQTALVVVALFILKEIHTKDEVIYFIFKRRSLLDFGNSAISNGLLVISLYDQNWEFVIILFMLSYIAAKSFYFKSLGIQNKLDRDKFEQLAYTDFLTGAYNRTFMDKKMDELSQTEEKIGIVVVDIDKFKRINDNYNHAIGDKVIQHFASTLKSYLSDNDYLFRSGGEEFTLCLRNRSYQQTAALVHEMVSGIADSPVNAEYNGENITLYYSASFGLYYYKVNKQTSFEKAYIFADELMYKSKQHGGNHLSLSTGLL